KMPPETCKLAKTSRVRPSPHRIQRCINAYTGQKRPLSRLARARAERRAKQRKASVGRANEPQKKGRCMDIQGGFFVHFHKRSRTLHTETVKIAKKAQKRRKNLTTRDFPFIILRITHPTIL
ncbi:MAG: hypothetical protein J6125_01405, partial [Clostridia bacterium]|nr:hypothetical protein [Clostridia bacterium]